MSQQLSYLQVVDDHGRAVVEPGVVRTDKVDTLGRKHPLRGRGLRLYQTQTTADGLSFAALFQLLANAQRALHDVVAEFRVHASYPATSAEVVLKSLGQVSRFASLDLAKSRVEILDLANARSLDELVGSWARIKGPNHLLLELDATDEILRALEGQIASAVQLQGRYFAPAASPPLATVATPALPAETAASAQRRDALAKDWLDAADVSTLLGSTAENTSQLPNRLRRDGRLLGVWIVAQNRYRFPPWQFDPTTHQVIPAMRELLALLRSERGVAGGRQTSGWEEIEWLCAPHALLAKQRPADVLATAPERVLDVARREFTEEPDARW